MKRQNSITPDDITNFLAEGALWRTTEAIHLFWGPFQVADESNNEEISISYPDFFDVQAGIRMVPSRHEVLSLSEFHSIFENFVKTHSKDELFCDLTKCQWNEASKESFVLSFSEIQKAIAEHKLSKAVPIVFESSLEKMTERSLIEILKNAAVSPDYLKVYGLWQTSQGRFHGYLGASPELLFELQGNELQTMALAGTLPRKGPDGNTYVAETLLRDPKERHEHELVLEDISEVLSQYGKPIVGLTSVLELPHLFHLMTPVSVKTSEEISVEKWLKLLHPTPALGVAPRAVGADWMLRLPEQKKRQKFGAPFVFRHAGRTTAIVAIRQIQWDEWGMRIGSGCGIVQESLLEKEWFELKQKRTSVKKLLGFLK